MNIVTIIGTRPQYIKANPVSRFLKERGIHEVVVNTGQHFDMDMSVENFSERTPLYNLKVREKRHGKMLARMIERIETVLLQEKSDLVIVYGDTNSTLAGALAASNLRIPIAHIEAGVRSYNRNMVEERNRVLVDNMSDLLFCPTKDSYHTLCRNECFSNVRVFFTGDVLLDIFLEKKKKLKKVETKRGILCTIHRAENVDNPARLGFIVKSLIDVQDKVKDPITFILHPRTKNKLMEVGMMEELPFILLEPQTHDVLLSLMNQSRLVITDSGGVQREAYWMGCPSVVMRAQTEWEIIEDQGASMREFMWGLDLSVQKMIEVSFEPKYHFFGSGKAAKNIVNNICLFLGGKK